MNLTQTLIILQSVNLDTLSLEIESQTNGKINRLTEFRKTFQAIRNLPGLEKFANAIADYPVFKSVDDTFFLSATEAQRLVNQAFTLQLASHVLRDALRKIVPPLSEGSIRIKLPDPADYKALLRDQETFAKSLELLIFAENIHGEIRIDGWENGSLWMTLFLGSQAVVALVGAAVWAAAVIRSHLINSSCTQHIVV